MHLDTDLLFFSWTAYCYILYLIVFSLFSLSFFSVKLQLM